MIVRKYSDIEAVEVEAEGAVGVRKRVLISADDGAPNFIMRMFSIEPEGQTPYHTHDWEHEVYVLSGNGVACQGDTENELHSGSVVLVEPGEDHNFRNTGDQPLVFLCLIPKNV